jgi:hypothetical protein
MATAARIKAGIPAVAYDGSDRCKAASRVPARYCGQRGWFMP